MAPQAAEPASPSRRERRKQEVRERILAAAARLFLRHGFEATTVDQIAEAADVAQKTFFNHFPTKHSVFEAFANGRLALFEDAVRAERRRGSSTRKRLERVFALMADHVSEVNELARDLVLHMMHAPPEDANGNEQFSTLQSAIGPLLRDGQEQGDVRRDHDVAFLTELIVGAFCMIMIQWAKDPSYPIRARLQETARFLGEAVAPPAA
ncbi:MAG: TetR/AcrR family transcriptional regulator [Deltaproteobacteria bacterium]|nr:TetR/AcrR family transcriptional regulator [Deltaproteobacteria bacterium]MBW2447681.1 TetR/AcrR family transcriptional regulator [Deltaproteobacteria bacterium]